MKFSRKHIVYSLVIIVLSLFLSLYQLPYYIYKPGSADELTAIVEVEGGYESEGEIYLVTVSSGQATPIHLFWAKLLPNHEIIPIEEVRPEGITEDEYMHAQLQMMESSQEASTVVAYEAANKDLKIEYNGIYVVSIIEDMPADGKLQIGDEIVRIDGKKLKESEELIEYIHNKKEGDDVRLHIIRDDEEIEETIRLKAFENTNNRVGIGVQLVTNRDVEVDPDVHFTSGNIGGPSAGLMFALEIYNQLIEEDITKGYKVVGTGAVDYLGNVSRIGGVDKKVIAADKAGCEIFFAPNENGASDSNYIEAKTQAEAIHSNMKIVPVDTFQDALDYLENLPPKK